MAITLGLVEAIDSNGVYVSMPGSRGVLRGPFETLQNVVAGDKVLVVTTDDGDCVVVGLAAAAVAGVSIPDGSITSAKIANGTIVDEDISASAAIAKTKIAGTAITAADTGTVTSTMIADGTIVNADISGSAAIDRSKISGLPTSSTDNTLPKFDSTGGALQTSGIVVDDNNRLRVASGSSGGLEIGSSGVLHISGTGGPSGIAAPVGSTWRQTDANSTHGSLTGLLWHKVGTGTTEGTDWLVDYEGRWISYTPTLTNLSGGSVSGGYTRRGKSIDFWARFLAGTVSTDPQIGIPVAAATGYRLPVHAQLGGPSFYQSIGQIYDTTVRVYYLSTNGAHLSIGSTSPFTWATNNYIAVNGTYEAA